MTIKELREILSKYPDDAIFEIELWEGYCSKFTPDMFSIYTATNLAAPYQREIVELDLTKVTNHD